MVKSNEVELRSPDHEIVSVVPIDGLIRYPSKSTYKSGPTPVDKGKGTWEIGFTCDRNGSEAVASDFAKLIGGSVRHACAEKKSGVIGLPSHLNFYFGVRVTLKGCAPADILLAQGHALGSNNWWIGGQNVLVDHMSDGIDFGGIGFLILRDGNNIPAYRKIDTHTSYFGFTRIGPDKRYAKMAAGG